MWGKKVEEREEKGGEVGTREERCGAVMARR